MDEILLKTQNKLSTFMKRMHASYCDFFPIMQNLK